MITTLFSGNSRIEKSILAVQLAAWRMLRGRGVHILDAETQRHCSLWSARREGRKGRQRLPVSSAEAASLYVKLDQLNTFGRDLVIDADGLDAPDTRTALVAAEVVVVPLCARNPDVQAEANVVAFLQRAQLFNPLLHVVLVVVGSASTGSVNVRADAEAIARRLRSAKLAKAVAHDSGATRAVFWNGQTLFEAEGRHDDAIAALDAIAMDVFGGRDTTSRRIPDLGAALARLRIWRHAPRAGQSSGVRTATDLTAGPDVPNGLAAKE